MTATEDIVTGEGSEARLAWGTHLAYVGAVVVCLVADQLTKAWVLCTLPLWQPVSALSWLAPILSFTHVENRGVAFGLFPELGTLFAVLSLLVVAGIVVFRRTLPANDLWLHGALGLVTGGAVGNLIDRVARGYVVDFLDVNFWPLATWPVFNIADSAIVVGVVILLVDSFLTGREGVSVGV